jgi:FAD/FMN-containing dehydrogenase
MRIARGEAGYEDRRRALVWNQRVPARMPALIVAPADGGEVAVAVREAAAAGLRVSVRSGGHNWLGSCLRDDAVVLDLGRLAHVEIDRTRRCALVGPGATHKAMADVLVAEGLAFPIGHCPSVGLGGYLTAGGAGWNLRAWGMGCWNVTGMDLVTADGERVYADERANADLFWAARGGGAGVPAVVTQFHVQLHPLPCICTVVQAYPAMCARELIPWAAARLPTLPSGVEISLILRPAQDGPSREPRVNVVATGFGSSPVDASDLAVGALNGASAANLLLARSAPQERYLNDLEGEGGWPDGFRHAADTCWVSGDLDEVGAIVGDAIAAAPSPLSRVVIAFGFSPSDAPDVAFSTMGVATVNAYATWTDEADDIVNAAWVRKTMEALAGFTTGHYIGETDVSLEAGRASRSYPPEKWAKLQEIVRRRDPEGRFHGFLSSAAVSDP